MSEYYKHADRLARRLGLSRSEIYARTIVQVVERHCRDDVTRRLNEVYGDSETAPALGPVWSEIQRRSLPRDDEW
jgi:hypothetical protein